MRVSAPPGTNKLVLNSVADRASFVCLRCKSRQMSSSNLSILLSLGGSCCAEGFGRSMGLKPSCGLDGNLAVGGSAGSSSPSRSSSCSSSLS